MKIYRKLTGGILTCIAMSSLLIACSEFAEREFTIDKPQSIIDQEKLDSYKELKSYIDYSGQPNFKLGVELTLATVADSTNILYRLMRRHFDEVNFTRLNHMDFVPADGIPVMTNLTAALEVNKMVGMPVYAGHLVQHSNQNATYLNKLIADLITPGETGTVVVENFESRTVGNSYPVFYSTDNTAGTATIAVDPVANGNSGKTLKLFGNRVFPQYQVNLPAGVTLGNCKKILFDMNAANGRYGAGMRLGISTAFGTVAIQGFNPNKSAADAGAPDGSWGRKLSLDLTTYPFTEAEKQLSSFVMTFGSETGTADMHIDNIALEWAKAGQVIPKTVEEKKTIITAELDKWIKAIGGAGKDKVSAWSVVYQPMDETNPSQLRSGPATGSTPANTFYWQNYLGKDYAAIAIEMLKKYANENAKIFFTETNLADNPAKIQGLKDFISYTEGKGSHVDGIATELALNVGADKSKVETMLQALAATGKLIKISALDIGTGGNTSQATPALYQDQAEMYKWFVKAYNSFIPAAQRAGITFRSPHDRASDDSWRPGEPVGLWTRFTSGSTVNAGYQRKPAYLGVVEAFQSK